MTWLGAFSTLGCAGSPLSEPFGLAQEGGWDGLELRAAPGEPVHVDLSPQARQDVRQNFAETGITPLSICSYVSVDDPLVTDHACVAAVMRHVELARDIGSPFVRVFPGGPSPDGAATRRLTAIARELGSSTSPSDVRVCLETHDTCSRSSDVARILTRINSDRVRAIWDIQHPWTAGESVEETIGHLLPFLAYVQINDVRSLDDRTPCLLGTGVLPLRATYDALNRAGYQGWISLEWPSYWYPNAPPLRDALRGARLWLEGTL